MKLKKIAVSLLLGATLAAGSAVCGAEGLDWITPQDMSLGGVEPGMSLDYVESIYGPMKDVQSHYVEHLFGYGDTVKIVSSADGMSVKSVLVKGNNGWATPAGVTVGMDASILQKIYGTGAVDSTKHKKHRMPGYDYYTYWQTDNPFHYLTFGVKNGKIAFIKVGLMQR